MIRELGRRSLHPRLRTDLVVALFRQQGDAATDALIARAADRREPSFVRKDVLFRLHRRTLNASQFERLKDLLFDPRGECDIVTACVLARLGENEAPSLVVEGLRYHAFDEPIARGCVAAANAIMGTNLRFPSQFTTKPGASTEDFLEAFLGRTRPHAKALTAWLAKHQPQTVFEKARRAYLTGRGREQELRYRTWKDVLGAGDKFDLAAAALYLTSPSDVAERDIEALDRLTRLARKRIGSTRDPQRVIAILNRVLLAGVEVDARIDSRQPPGESGWPRVPHVALRMNKGNCLSYSILYAGVCERLGYPVGVISSPYHAFLRWDDGTSRINIETTDDGKQIDDVEYSGSVFLKKKNSREALAMVLNNFAVELGRRGDWKSAEMWAARAVRLDAGEYLAYLSRAIARFELDRDTDSVLSDFAASLRIYPENNSARLLLASTLLRVGRYREGVKAVERVSGSQKQQPE